MEKVSQFKAGYKEKKGAVQDAGCAKVQGWVSTKSGTCDLFEPSKPGGAKLCGDCRHVRKNPQGE